MIDRRIRVALVTGGARRVGRAIVLELARHGHDLAIHYHQSADDAGRVADEIVAMGRRAVTIAGDLTQPESWPVIVRQTVRALGGLDVLVNNASAFLAERTDSLDAFDVSLWQSMWHLNLMAPVALVSHARPHLSATGRGKVVNLGDSAVDRPGTAHLAYSAAKAALTTLTKSLARELAPTIQVNTVAPGIAVFPESYPADLRNKLVDRVPLKREGTPEEVARLVRFLVEEGDYITGQVIPIDGGRNTI